MADAPVPFRAAIGELARLKVFWAVLIVGVVSVSLMLSFGRSRGSAVQPAEPEPEPLEPIDPASLPTYGSVPAFSFTDQTGAKLTDRQLRGNVAIASFIFTRCPTVCPVVTMKMKKLGERTASEPRILLLSFSVDPEHDTPRVLAEFAARHAADPARWKFLTGDPGAIRSTVEGALKIAMDRQGELAGGVPDIVHGTHLVLLDDALRIRGYYDYTEPDRLDALVRDALALATTTTPSAHKSHR